MKERKSGIDLGWLSDSRNEIYGFAILWVMVFHGFDWNHLNYSLGHEKLKFLQDIVCLGNCGVEIFLLLSGVGLYFSFSRNQDTLRFYKRRYQRVFPALWMICGTYFLYTLLKDIFINNVAVPRAAGLFFCKMTQLSFWFGNDRFAWYVAAVAAFYFVYPFVYHFLYDDSKKIGRRFLILVGITLLAMIAVKLGSERNGNYLYNRFEIATSRFTIFVIGCGLGKLVYDRRKISWLWLAVSVLFLLLVLKWCSEGLIDWHYPSDKSIDLIKQRLIKHGLWRYFLGLIGICVTCIVGVVFHFISWKPFHAFFKFFGDMSLELYLAHTTLFCMAKIFWDITFTFKKYFFVVLLSIPVAWVVMKIENALLSKKPKKVAPQTA